MSLEVKGGVELRDDVARMADLLRTSGSNGTRACNYILQTAAQPVLTRMLHNASTDPKRRSGTLYNSIRIGRVVKKRSGGYRVTVGVHRADGGAGTHRSSQSSMPKEKRPPSKTRSPPTGTLWPQSVMLSGAETPGSNQRFS